MIPIFFLPDKHKQFLLNKTVYVTDIHDNIKCLKRRGSWAACLAFLVIKHAQICEIRSQGLISLDKCKY